MFGPSQQAKPAMTSKSYQIISNHPLAGVSCPKGTKMFKDQFSYLKEFGNFTILWMPGPRIFGVESSTWDDTPDRKTLLLLLLRDVQRIGIRAPRSLVNARSDIPLEKMSFLTWQYHPSSPAKKNSSILKNFQNHSLEASIYMTTCLSPSCSTFPGFNPAIEIRPSPVLGKESGGQLRLGGWWNDMDEW